MIRTTTFQMPAGYISEALLISDGIQVARRNTPGKWKQRQRDAKGHGRLGVVAEFCLRWAFRMPMWDRTTYPSFDDRREGDVGEDCEVRSTDHPKGKLLLHEEDGELPDLLRNYALVVLGGEGRFRLPGWLPMPVAKSEWFFFDPTGKRPCQAVNQNRLWPIRHLVITEDGVKYRMRVELLGGPE